MAFRDPVADDLPRYPLIIGDKREERGSGATLAHVYPGTGKVTREIAMANAADVDRAVAAARAAFPAWKAMPGDRSSVGCNRIRRRRLAEDAHNSVPSPAW